MRLAFLSASSQTGGAEIALLQLLHELRVARPSWDLHLVVPGAGPLAERAAALGVEVTHLPVPASLLHLGEWGASGGRATFAARLVGAAAGLPRYERELSRTLSAIRPDVVHSNAVKSHITAARAKSAAPLVWHLHDYVGARPVSRTLLRRYATRPAAIVAASESVAQDARSVLATPGPVHVVHNGVDLDRFSPDGDVCDLDAPAALAAPPPGTVRVGLVATFARWKGQDTFLRAIAAIPRDVPVRAYVIGAAVYDTEGSQYSDAELRELAATLGIQRLVGFTGFVPAIAGAMRALDVVVHASVAPEPFGLVIAEAMACGRALVTSGTGGAAELVRHGKDALVFTPGDHRMLADTVVRLARDRELRVALGSAARRAACARFDARRFGGEFAEIYEAAAGRSGQSRQDRS